MSVFSLLPRFSVLCNWELWCRTICYIVNAFKECFWCSLQHVVLYINGQWENLFRLVYFSISFSSAHETLPLMLNNGRASDNEAILEYFTNANFSACFLIFRNYVTFLESYVFLVEFQVGIKYRGWWLSVRRRGFRCRGEGTRGRSKKGRPNRSLSVRGVGCKEQKKHGW